MRLMKKFAGLFLLVSVCGGLALAQDTQTPAPDQSSSTEPAKPKHSYPTPKGEISAGFVYRTYYGSSAGSIGMIGAYGSYIYDFYKWLGLEAEFMGVRGTLKLSNLPPEDLHVFTALVGPKVYLFGHHRLDPYGHFNYGAGILATSVPEFAGYGGNAGATAVRAWQVGGGVDLSIKRHWAVRVVQLDYASAKFLGNGVPNQGGKRVSFGITYRFGER